MSIKMTLIIAVFSKMLIHPISGQSILIDRDNSIFQYGGIVRFDTTKKIIFLTFTGGDFNDGTRLVRDALKRENVLASFFFTGDFYRTKANRRPIRNLIMDGHYMGAHSDKHLLYASWENRDSLLVNRQEFVEDLLSNYQIMERFGLRRESAYFFMPPYEWYNDSISIWTSMLGHQLINYTQGTRSNADYTTPDMGAKYVSSEAIMQSILQFERKSENGLNGFILLLHVGTDPKRTDKYYHRLTELIGELRRRDYQFLSLNSVELNGSP